MVFDGVRHSSVAIHAELAERSVAVFSFGKTLHATGWRVGYAIASPEITREIRRVHQFNTFTIPTPMQHAIAAFLTEVPEHSAELALFYQAKRDFFLQRLQGSRFGWQPTPGTYFQLLDFSAISSQSDVEFADTLLTGVGVASIPISPFYAAPMRSSLLRFCFAKGEATLSAAAERLCRL
jgi:methionine aminotransferase